MNDEIKAKFEQFAKENGISNAHVRIKNHRTEDHYYEKHDIDFDKMMENIDEIEFDREMAFRNRHPTIDEETVRKNIEEILVELYDEDDPVAYGVTVKEDGEMVFTMDENGLPIITQDLLAYVQECYDNADISNYDSYEFELLFGESYDFIEESDIYDALAFWTLYFEPRWFDEEIAYQCGLIPFEYEGIKLLALGGCGMDLSPKLDAYQAFVTSSIPSDSTFFNDKRYFDYVVGDNTAKRVEEEITLPNPKIVFTGDIE